ncbi:protein NO VEIN domain-containing protein [Phormidium sp. CCY1219]|uniref:protein NO VEIN domain-containing protein n=1 Tax=Phormidium sp. CCY1219 TaxID=2886104 RepID=UPI002D1EF66A|nr:DUF3883 domain-containing protein [Phormidium sp. CCY1219]MEB3828877.1 DUF3883 domain-containing protein [Phormidium sp. CCY1219]
MMMPILPMPSPKQDDLLKSMQEIYRYIYNNFVDSNRADREQQQRLERDFQNRECLWDENTEKFWKPNHAFEEDVSFFGTHRVTIPFSHRTGEVYRLLGQKPRPDVDDYLDFLQDLADEYNTSPLTEEDKDCVIQVLHRLESKCLESSISSEIDLGKNVPVLTTGGTLRVAQEVLIPDAPWRQSSIEENRLLHPRVSVTLAKSAGSLSLLRDVKEEVTEYQLDSEPTVNDWCREWQATLNSPEFHSGLNRLIFHESNDFNQPEMTFPKISVLPAHSIKLNLWLNNIKVASDVNGDYYFYEYCLVLYVISAKNKETMVGYIAEALNNSLLDDFLLKNLWPLVRILDTDPAKIKGLLDELRIRALPGDESEKYRETDSHEEPTPDTQTPEEETTQAPDRETKPSTQTDTGRSENSIYWGEFGEAWAKCFYTAFGYSRIDKQPDWAGFDFLCQCSGKPQIKAEVKAITSTRPNIPITINEWSKMVEIGEAYELLIVSHQGETVSEIIQVKHLWKTIQNDFLGKLRQKKPTKYAGEEAEVLLGFNLNSDKQRNNIIISWHRLCEGNISDNIKIYRPSSSNLSSENEEVKFKLLNP